MQFFNASSSLIAVFRPLLGVVLPPCFRPLSLLWPLHYLYPSLGFRVVCISVVQHLV